MILLFTHRHDKATKQVCEWLAHYGHEFIRLNDGERIRLQRVELNNGNERVWIEVQGRRLELSEITHTFFRGGSVQVDDYYVDPYRTKRETKLIETEYPAYISNYSMGKLEYLVYRLNRGANTLGLNSLGRYNKIIALQIATHTGMHIPDTLLTNRRTDVQAFLDRHGRIITKSLDIGFSCYDALSGGSFHLYTSALGREQVEALPEYFPLSKFQQQIDKRYEVRTFYLRGQCYSTAVFSQQHEQTKVDSRRYDLSRMNRMVPYRLPEDLEARVRQLMQLAGLDTGSLDFIKDTQGRYVFLEVNPIGQYGYVSDTCNYHLHREIARALTGAH